MIVGKPGNGLPIPMPEVSTEGRETPETEKSEQEIVPKDSSQLDWSEVGHLTLATSHETVHLTASVSSARRAWDHTKSHVRDAVQECKTHVLDVHSDVGVAFVAFETRVDDKTMVIERQWSRFYGITDHEVSKRNILGPIGAFLGVTALGSSIYNLVQTESLKHKVKVDHKHILDNRRLIEVLRRQLSSTRTDYEKQRLLGIVEAQIMAELAAKEAEIQSLTRALLQLGRHAFPDLLATSVFFDSVYPSILDRVEEMGGRLLVLGPLDALGQHLSYHISRDEISVFLHLPVATAAESDFRLLYPVDRALRKNNATVSLSLAKFLAVSGHKHVEISPMDLSMCDKQGFSYFCSHLDQYEVVPRTCLAQLYYNKLVDLAQCEAKYVSVEYTTVDKIRDDQLNFTLVIDHNQTGLIGVTPEAWENAEKQLLLPNVSEVEAWSDDDYSYYIVAGLVGLFLVIVLVLGFFCYKKCCGKQGGSAGGDAGQGQRISISLGTPMATPTSPSNRPLPLPPVQQQDPEYERLRRAVYDRRNREILA